MLQFWFSRFTVGQSIFLVLYLRKGRSIGSLKRKKQNILSYYIITSKIQPKKNKGNDQWLTKHDTSKTFNEQSILSPTLWYFKVKHLKDISGNVTYFLKFIVFWETAYLHPRKLKYIEMKKKTTLYLVALYFSLQEFELNRMNRKYYTVFKQKYKTKKKNNNKTLRKVQIILYSSQMMSPIFKFLLDLEEFVGANCFLMMMGKAEYKTLFPQLWVNTPSLSKCYYAKVKMHRKMSTTQM